MGLGFRPQFEHIWSLGRGWREIRHWHEPCSEYPLLHASLFVSLTTGNCVFAVHTRSQQLALWPAWHPVVWEDRDFDVRAFVAKFIRKAVSGAAAQAEKASAAGQHWVDTHPAIWEYLSECVGPEGEPRDTSMLCVFVEDGLVKMALQDRQEGLSLWVSAPSLIEAFSALERRLEDGSGEWRQSRGGRAAKGQKKK